MTTSPRIVIVEDEMIIALDLQTRLQRLGCTVLATATSGEDAIRIVAASQPDLIFMDIGLSGQLDGIDTAAHIHAQAAIPIVFLSAYTDPSTRTRMAPIMPSSLIAKPFADAELREALRLLPGG